MCPGAHCSPTLVNLSVSVSTSGKPPLQPGSICTATSPVPGPAFRTLVLRVGPSPRLRCGEAGEGCFPIPLIALSYLHQHFYVAVLGHSA